MIDTEPEKKEEKGEFIITTEKPKGVAFKDIVMGGMPRLPKKKKVLSKLKILEVIRTTPGGFHSWVRTSKGIFRKNNNTIKV